MPLYRTAYRARTEEPQDHGFLAWLAAPSLVTGAALNVSGTLYATRIQVPATISTTGIAVQVTAALVTPTASQNLLGLYTSAGAKIAQTADQGAVWNTTGFKQAAWTGGPFVIAGGPSVYVLAAFLSVATTPATFRGLNNTVTFVTSNQTGLGLLSSTMATQTTIPTTYTPGAASGLAQWAALY